MFISKRKLKKYMEMLWANNRAEKLGQINEHDSTLSKDQKQKNIYLQGFEDGTDNFFNAFCHEFGIKSIHRVG